MSSQAELRTELSTLRTENRALSGELAGLEAKVDSLLDARTASTLGGATCSLVDYDVSNDLEPSADTWSQKGKNAAVQKGRDLGRGAAKLVQSFTVMLANEGKAHMWKEVFGGGSSTSSEDKKAAVDIDCVWEKIKSMVESVAKTEGREVALLTAVRIPMSALGSQYNTWVDEVSGDGSECSTSALYLLHR